MKATLFANPKHASRRLYNAWLLRSQNAAKKFVFFMFLVHSEMAQAEKHIPPKALNESINKLQKHALFRLLCKSAYSEMKNFLTFIDKNVICILKNTHIDL
jgi:hypothetical protein